MYFREATEHDLPAVLTLYREVSRLKGGIVRSEDELTDQYIRSVYRKVSAGGLMIVCEHPDDPATLIGEIHGSKNGLAAFDHVLMDVTLVIHPAFQGRKIGKTILTIFLDEIATNRLDIGKVELMVRESNERAIALYQSRGFRIEGRLEMRIRTSTRAYEADIPMGWQNPNFEF